MLVVLLTMTPRGAVCPRHMAQTIVQLTSEVKARIVASMPMKVVSSITEVVLSVSVNISIRCGESLLAISGCVVACVTIVLCL